MKNKFHRNRKERKNNELDLFVLKLKNFDREKRFDMMIDDFDRVDFELFPSKHFDHDQKKFLQHRHSVFHFLVSKKKIFLPINRVVK